MDKSDELNLIFLNLVVIGLPVHLLMVIAAEQAATRIGYV